MWPLFRITGWAGTRHVELLPRFRISIDVQTVLLTYKLQRGGNLPVFNEYVLRAQGALEDPTLGGDDLRDPGRIRATHGDGTFRILVPVNPPERHPVAGDNRTGSYLPVIHALRDSLTVLHVQDYNSGPVMGLDNQYHFMGGADFHIAMTDMLKSGFTVSTTGLFFPGLRDDQIAIGLPAAVSAGNGYTSPADVQTAVNCLVKNSGCGSYTLRGGTQPAMRGLMTWSINWDKYYGWAFQNSHEPFLNALP